MQRTAILEREQTTSKEGICRARVTLIPGDGIGPEVADAMRRVVDASGAGIEWEVREAGESVMRQKGDPLPDDVLESIRRNRVAIKGPITTPVGTGFRSVNVRLRKELDLYACVRPCFSIRGVKSRFENIDLVVVRENTEDLYAGDERMVDLDTAESIKRISRKASRRIARFAFEYARRNCRRKVTAVHKANIMKLSDGLFLECARDIASEYPDIVFEDKIVDNMCMQLVLKPEAYDVILAPNLYGDIISDLCAGLIGGLGVAAGANIGDGAAVFEAVHGSVPKYAGLKRANPTGLILSACLMLSYLGMEDKATVIRTALEHVIAEGKSVTQDLGGVATTDEMADAIIERMQQIRGE